MKKSFLNVTQVRSQAMRVLVAGTLALCGVAGLAGAPALADTAEFAGQISATVTVPTIANVISNGSPDPSPFSFTFLQGNAWAAGQSNSFSWSNGALSLSSGSASGGAASQLGNAFNYSLLLQQSIPTLQFTNDNPYAVEIPLTASLTYSQNISCPSCGQYSMDGATSSAWLYLYTLQPDPYDYLGTMGLNCFLGGPYGPPYSGACMANSDSPSGTSFPVNGTFTETVDYWVPADSTGTLAVELQSEYQASVATPEPRSWVLLATGLLGLLWVCRLRLQRI